MEQFPHPVSLLIDDASLIDKAFVIGPLLKGAEGAIVVFHN
jgi:hypothetical protein